MNQPTSENSLEWTKIQPLSEITKETILKTSDSIQNDFLHRKSGGFVDNPIIQKTMEWVKEPKNNALGLASRQVGDLGNWFVFKDSRTSQVRLIINPILIGKLGQKTYKESCFSEEGAYIVKRPKSILIEHGTPECRLRETFEGRDAQVVSHELDHNRGKLLSDIGELLE